MTWTGFPLSQISRLELMGQDMADDWIKKNHPQVTAEERKDFINRTIPVLPQRPKPDRFQRKFITTAWLCGASLRQLGVLCQIAPQTVSMRIDREMKGVADRTSMRLAPPEQSYERVEEIRNKFYIMARAYPEDIEGMTAYRIAKIIMTDSSMVAEDNMPSEYTAHDTTDRKIEVEPQETAKTADVFTVTPELMKLMSTLNDPAK